MPVMQLHNKTEKIWNNYAKAEKKTVSTDNEKFRILL